DDEARGGPRVPRRRPRRSWWREDARRAREQSRLTRRALLIGAGFLLGVVLVLTGIFLPQLFRAAQHQALRDSVRDFLVAPGGTETSQGPYVTGKVVLVDKTKAEVDALQRRLPDELRAYTPGEVGTVVWLEFDVESKSGEYSDTLVFTPRCKVTVIDRQRNPGVGQTT